MGGGWPTCLHGRPAYVDGQLAYMADLLTKYEVHGIHMLRIEPKFRYKRYQDLQSTFLI